MSQTYTITQLDDAAFAACAAALSPLPIPIEQSPEWGRFDDTISERQFLGSFRYDDEGTLRALASATLYRQRGRNWIWVKHGPLFPTVPNTDVVKKMCSTLTHQFKAHSSKPIFVRLTTPTFTRPLVFPFEHTMYDETVVIDLTKPEETLLAEMSQSGRQGIRKALKANVVVHEIPPDQAVKAFAQDFYPILAETAQRGRFGIHPINLYTSMLENLQPYVRLYGGYVNNDVTTWAITTEYNGHALYYYGASNSAARDNFAPYLLHWEIIKVMKARGLQSYDFMGIAGKHYPSLKNVTQFKMKFSKEIQKVPVTYDLPLQPIKYHLLGAAVRTKRKLRK